MRRNYFTAPRHRQYHNRELCPYGQMEFDREKDQYTDVLRCPKCWHEQESPRDERRVFQDVGWLLDHKLSPLFAKLVERKWADNGKIDGFDKLEDNFTRLRLDYEIPTEQIADQYGSIEDRTFGATAFGMFSVMKNDLTDLLVDGDTNSTDPLLKTMDGLVKRQQIPFELRFVEPSVYVEFKPTKDAFETTLYLGIEVHSWHDVQDRIGDILISRVNYP